MDDPNLCYLDADKVQTPVGDLGGVSLRRRDNAELGSVKGVLIEPAAGKVRYFVLQEQGPRRKRCYLVSADAPLRLEPDAHTLLIESDEPPMTRCDPREIQAVRPYSDDDLLAAMRASTAA